MGREAQEEFESAIFVAAGLFDNNFSFDYSGPFEKEKQDMEDA